jgi:hypothetical protein
MNRIQNRHAKRRKMEARRNAIASRIITEIRAEEKGITVEEMHRRDHVRKAKIMSWAIKHHKTISMARWDLMDISTERIDTLDA